jgi:hypothetical protein
MSIHTYNMDITIENDYFFADAEVDVEFEYEAASRESHYEPGYPSNCTVIKVTLLKDIVYDTEDGDKAKIAYGTDITKMLTASDFESIEIQLLDMTETVDDDYYPDDNY